MSECKKCFLRVNVGTLGQMKNSSVDLAGKMTLVQIVLFLVYNFVL